MSRVKFHYIRVLNAKDGSGTAAAVAKKYSKLLRDNEMMTTQFLFGHEDSGSMKPAEDHDTTNDDDNYHENDDDDDHTTDDDDETNAGYLEANAGAKKTEYNAASEANSNNSPTDFGFLMRVMLNDDCYESEVDSVLK
jgi:hypothetical protein